jgi:1-acyl-sn-glycerol-3-phosphate acyltransferase
VTPFQHLKAALSLLAIGVNLIFFCVPLVVLALAKVVRPHSAYLRRAMAALYRTAVAVDDAWLRHVVGARWLVPALELPRERNCIVLCNHVSWADILLAQSLIAPAGPVPKFLCKRELVWLPMIGIVAWAYDFPLLKRHARRPEDEDARRAADIARVRDACAILRDAPAAMLSFVEGTRFTPEKRVARESPFAHLMQPRTGGFQAMCESLSGLDFSIVDATLIYSPGTTFWRFIAGAADPVEVRVAVLDGAELADADFNDWLNARWRKKDQLLSSAVHSAT